MSKLVNKDQFFKFNFDISTYRLLGRELITDRITALFELVKNSYDANSNVVTVEFEHLNDLGQATIKITDDGLGMSLEDIQYGWMVIGTSNKRRNRQSPPPYNRKVSGKKGVGRFAVDQLGAKLLLTTKKLNTDERICLETDWSEYEKKEQDQLRFPFEEEKEYFTDVLNRYWMESGTKDKQGTILTITNIYNSWTEADVKRAEKELSKLVAPNRNPIKPFKIFIKAPYEGFENKEVKANQIDFATEEFTLTFDIKKNEQEILSFSKGKMTKVMVPIRPCGPIELKLYYFNQEDKRRYKTHFGADIDGVKVYRDGIITTPFAEFQADKSKQKDILGLDKRRWSNFWDRLGTRDLLGYIFITDERNDGIVESTNRQDFVDNRPWTELKLFLIEQIHQIEQYLVHQKREIRETLTSSLGETSNEIDSIKNEVTTLKKDASPDAKLALSNIESNLGKIKGQIAKNLKEQKKIEDEAKQRENLYFSLVSLQSYAAMFSHMTKHTIGRIIRDSEYFAKNFPNPKLDDRFLKIAGNVYREMDLLRKGVDFMLKYAKSDTDLEEIDLKELASYLFEDIYGEVFNQNQIETEVVFPANLIVRYNKKAMEDIFDNLITNSVKAVKNAAVRKIKCTGVADSKKLTILFSDTGYGIQEENKFRIFDIFFTTTAEDGGAGMGLYMVKTRIEAMQGSIELVDSEFGDIGTTIKMTLPFNK